jgi:glycosyltransferase involved in cell wall biosynthesis
MKILAVYPYVPWPLNRGAYHRAYHLLKGLSVDHEIDLIALAEKGEGAEHSPVFREFCDCVDVVHFEHPAWQRLFPKRLLNPVPSTIAHWDVAALRRELAKAFAREKYDAVHVLDLVLAQFFLKEHQTIPLVLDRTRVDLQYQMMEHEQFRSSLKNRLLHYENCAKLRTFEKKVAKRCALQVLCGPDDEAFVREEISRTVPVTVIPNGVDLDYFHPNSSAQSRAAEPTVIFCGAMDYNPNVDALRWYFAEIHEALKRHIPKLQVLIVGKDPIAEVKAYAQKLDVTVTGGVPDVRPYYKKAWLQIVPLRIGGGTRLKIAESLGIGTPVVSTTIGAQGLDLKHRFDILYADTAKDFVEQTATALGDETLRATLQRNGRASAEARLSWHKLGADLSRAYEKHIAPKARVTDGRRVRESEPVDALT